LWALEAAGTIVQDLVDQVRIGEDKEMAPAEASMVERAKLVGPAREGLVCPCDVDLQQVAHQRPSARTRQITQGAPPPCRRERGCFGRADFGCDGLHGGRSAWFLQAVSWRLTPTPGTRYESSPYPRRRENSNADVATDAIAPNLAVIGSRVMVDLSARKSKLSVNIHA
jgi:hypothetical protein